MSKPEALDEAFLQLRSDIAAAKRDVKTWTRAAAQFPSAMTERQAEAARRRLEILLEIADPDDE